MDDERSSILVQHVDDLRVKAVSRLADHQSFFFSDGLWIGRSRRINDFLGFFGQHPVVGDVPLVPVVPAVSHNE